MFCELVEFEIDFLVKNSTVTQPIDSDGLKKDFCEVALKPGRKPLPLSVGQTLVMKTETKSSGNIHLSLTVSKIEREQEKGKPFFERNN